MSKHEVPFFEPIIRKPSVFEKDENLKNFLLSKLINAEYASLKAPAFSPYTEKTLEQSIGKLCENLENLTQMFTVFDLNRFGSSLSPSNSHSRLSEETNSNLSLPYTVTNITPTQPSNIKGIWRKFSVNFLGQINEQQGENNRKSNIYPYNNDDRKSTQEKDDQNDLPKIVKIRNIYI